VSLRSFFSNRKSGKNELIDGDWNAIDDVTGFKVKASTITRQWDGMRTNHAVLRHPQDFIRAQAEQIRTPWARGEPGDTFSQTDADDL
jgi:hypothetical protein